VSLDLTNVTVGVVTALPVEGAAIRTMVEALHPIAISGDPNYYHVGWLASSDPKRPHQVVVTILPQDGTRNASAVTVDLVRSFPTVRCVIMCGIAGGVPAPGSPERHVRLGDVVVASEGVIDYDHVRTVDGHDQLRRPTEGLSRDLLRAMRELQVGAISGERPWELWLEPGGSSSSTFFARPSDSSDVVFQGGTVVKHPSRRSSGHVRGKPLVHYAAIGSADRLLRDEVRRDEIAERYRIKAVEMEASGIAVSTTLHSIHWFVVRGIADYCDNVGKNDKWHPYASLAAAAYVRALLEHCHPFITSQRSASLRLGHIVDIPLRRRNFTGRGELINEIRELLASGRASGLGATALYGLGGVGKTEVAIEYAYRYLDDYDLVALIPAAQAPTIISSLSRLAIRLGVPHSESNDELIAGLWAKLREQSRWLLIFDDAQDEHELGAYWPRGGSGHVLVTSRSRFWATVAVAREVPVFDREESVSFVARRARSSDPGSASSLAAELGDLPLALEQAAAYIDETAISINAYLDLLQSRSHDLPETHTMSPSAVTVTSTWLVSLGRLRDEAPAAEQVLCLLAYVGPHAFPRPLLQSASPRRAVDLRMDTLAFNSSVAVLRKYSLASVTEDAISVHVLVQHVVRATLALDERLKWAGAAMQLIDEGLPASTDNTRDWPVFEVLLSHALSVTAHEEAMRAEPNAAASALFKAARYVRLLGDLPRAEELLARSNVLCRNQGLQVAKNLTELGGVQREMDRLTEALESFERSQDIWRAEPGDHSFGKARALVGIATIRFDLGQGTRARQAGEESLTILRGRPDADPLDIAHALTILGLVLWGLLNDFNGAVAAHRESAVIRAQLLGPDHLQVAISLDNLGKALLASGNLTEALQVTERARAIRETRLGDRHPRVALTLNHIGDILCATGDYARARAAHELAKEIFVDRLGPGHSHVARSLEGLGQDFFHIGELALAEQHFGEALDIWEKAIGINDWGAAEILTSLGQVRQARGNLAQARIAYTRAIEILTGLNSLGDDHQDIVKVRNLLKAIDSSDC
jgi:nucleoside phosphorylase/tetratricopeptide (TPR) repeat protein